MIGKDQGEGNDWYAERVSERIVVCGTKEKGRKQERVENMEAKNLPHGRTLTTKVYTTPLSIHIYRTVMLFGPLTIHLSVIKAKNAPKYSRSYHYWTFSYSSYMLTLCRPTSI